MRSLGSTYPIILVLIQFLNPIFGLSDQRLCADPQCREIISIARTAITYTAGEEGMVSFKINSPVRVKSKSAGSDPSLWGIEVNGRQGYANKDFLREEKVLISDKNLKHIVAVEPVGGKKQLNVPKENLKPSEVSTEAKTSQATATTNATPPLSEEPDAETTTLNSSESTLETTTTAPLMEPINEEVIQKSLKEMATPVLNKMEIIDGTAIPVLEDLEADTLKKQEQDAEKKATTKNDEIEKEKSNGKLEHTTDSNKKTKKKSTKSEAEASKKAERIQTESAEEQRNVITPDTGEDDTLKLVDAVIELDNVDSKNNNDTNSQINGQSEEVVEEKVGENAVENKTGQDIELTQTAKDEQSISTQEDSKAVNETQTASLDNNEIKISAATESPSETLKQVAAEPIKSNNILHDAFEDDEDAFDEEDEDDIDEDDDDVDENDIDDKLESGFKSSSVELTTETPQQVTDSGFSAASNMHYWEDVEIESTTISPVPMQEANPSNATEDKENLADKLKDAEGLPSSTGNAIADNSKTTEDIVEDIKLNEDNTPTPIAQLADEMTDALEETTTQTPQVPSTTMTLPNLPQPKEPQAESIQDAQQIENVENEQQKFEKVTEPPAPKPIYDPYQHINHYPQQQQQDKPIPLQQSNEHINYENPNDYYRRQAEHLQNSDEAKSTEMPITTEAQPISESTHSAEVSGTTAPVADPIEEHDGNLGAGTIEMITPPPLPAQNAHDFSNDEIPTHSPIDEKRDAGLFGTILGTVNTFVNKLRKEEPSSDELKSENIIEGDDELERILYPDRYAAKISAEGGDEEYCEQLSPHHCPKSKNGLPSVDSQQCSYDWQHISMDNFVEVFIAKAFEMRELLSCLAIASSTILLFLFGYYCFCNNNREGALISKLNLLERSLLASHKENAILKDDLQKTRNKLTSIEDNSFGSNDMVIALRKELETNAEEKRQLEEQIHSLEKELETAAEAGLELNKIVAELINSQTGHESMIMNSVEDLQIQFNEQQKTILEINANLAEKSRENSELQLMLAEQNARFNGEIASLQQDNDELEAEKSVLQTRLTELKTEFEEDISKALEGKNVEIKRLQNEIVDLNNNFEDIRTKWQTGLAKIEALEECMKTLKKDSNVNITEVINVANVRAELLDLQKQRSALKSRLDVETEARQHAELGLQNSISEVDKLKQDFHQSEKDKLEAQTRLEVLSNYFKEKETQLQKELSLKEAVWLKQQGENTSTVDRLTAMQEEIQSLKSQNDALRAEIEAQLAAHKAQTGTLENRAHETWLAARQSERRFEEARAEAAALRRRLTELAGAAANGGEGNRNVDGKLSIADFNNAPSPILPPPALMDANAGSPLLGTLPPPPHQYLPFLAPPPPPFLNLPPPPFLQSVEMRPAPLGRMMSPTSGRYSPNERERKRPSDGYYEREYDDDYDDDYDVEEDDYDYDDEDEQDERTRNGRPRRRSGNGSDSEWQRDNYSPPPPDRSYRSHSPTDSRYNYTYDDETDLSPPPSPPGRRGRDGGGGSRTGSYHTFTPRSAATASPNVVPERTSKKGIPNSDSDKSHNSTHHHKKGKSLV